MTNLPGESFFRSYDPRSVRLVVLAAVVFHAAVVLTLYAVSQIKVVKEPELIPVFELVQVAEPAPVPAPPPPAPSVPEPVEPKTEPTPKPVTKPVPPKPLPPEPKIEERVEPEPEPEPVEEVVEETPAEPADDFNIDDMAPSTPSEKSSLKPVGSVAMDPLLQAFLERLKQLVMQNFNPPNGIQIPRSAKTTVQFTVDAAGNIADVLLKTSSGNKTWDALSVRAVQITKSPALPATYSGDLLSLQFNFTPN